MQMKAQVLGASFFLLGLSGNRMVEGAISTFTTGDRPTNIDFDSGNNAWMSTTSSYIIKMSNDGATKTNYLSGIVSSGLAVDSSDNIWVSDLIGNQLLKVKNNGTILASGIAGKSPNIVTIAPNGEVWTSNSASNDVTKFSSACVSAFNVSVGNQPYQMVGDASSNMWLGVLNVGVLKLNRADGSTAVTVSGIIAPFGLAITSDGKVWVGDMAVSKLYLLDGAGTKLKTITVTGSLFYAALDPHQHVWFSDSNGKVWEFDATGQLANEYTVGATPNQVRADKSGNVWVCNTNDGTVSKIPATTNSPTSPTNSPTTAPPTTASPTLRQSSPPTSDSFTAGPNVLMVSLGVTAALFLAA